MTEEILRVEKEGFQGIYIKAATDSSKAMIVVGGSEGGINAAHGVAKAFAEEGIHCLAVAYWGTEQTTNDLVLIPIEIIQKAVCFLKEKGYEKVGIYGVSKGAELSLIAASLMPELQFVIAVSPSCCVFEGIKKKACSGTSSWTWKGNPLEYLSFDGIPVNMMKNILKNKEMGLRKEYLQALEKHKKEENIIKVEQINGPILLLSAKDDAQWPAEIMGNMVVERLQEKNFGYLYHHETYYPASHMLCPVRRKKSQKLIKLLYRIERKQYEACTESREKAFRMALEWIGKV